MQDTEDQSNHRTRTQTDWEEGSGLDRSSSVEAKR